MLTREKLQHRIEVIAQDFAQHATEEIALDPNVEDIVIEEQSGLLIVPSIIGLLTYTDPVSKNCIQLSPDCNQAELYERFQNALIAGIPHTLIIDTSLWVKTASS